MTTTRRQLLFTGSASALALAAWFSPRRARQQPPPARFSR